MSNTDDAPADPAEHKGGTTANTDDRADDLPEVLRSSGEALERSLKSGDGLRSSLAAFLAAVHRSPDHTAPACAWLADVGKDSLSTLSNLIQPQDIVAELKHGGRALAVMISNAWESAGRSHLLVKIAEMLLARKAPPASPQTAEFCAALAGTLAYNRPKIATSLIDFAASLKDHGIDSTLAEARQRLATGLNLQQLHSEARVFWIRQLRLPDSDVDWQGTEAAASLRALKTLFKDSSVDRASFQAVMPASIWDKLTGESDASEAPPVRVPVPSSKVAEAEPALPPATASPDSPVIEPVAAAPKADLPPSSKQPETERDPKVPASAASEPSREERRKADATPNEQPLKTAPDDKTATQAVVETQSPPAGDTETDTPRARKASWPLFAGGIATGLVLATAAAIGLITGSIKLPPEWQAQLAGFSFSNSSDPALPAVEPNRKPDSDPPASMITERPAEIARPSPSAPEELEPANGAAAATPQPQPETAAKEPAVPQVAPDSPPAVAARANTESSPPKPEASSGFAAWQTGQVEMISRAFPGLQRWHDRVHSSSLTDVMAILGGHHPSAPRDPVELRALLRWLTIDPPESSEVRRLILNLFIRNAPPLECVDVFEPIVKNKASDADEVRRAAEVIVGLYSERLTPQVKARLDALIANADK